MLHDHIAGVSTVWHGVDLLTVVDSAGQVTARGAAALLFETEKPSAAQVEKARRRLDALVRSGELVPVAAGQTIEYVRPDLFTETSR